MLTYRDIDVNHACLSITESNNTNRFVDILQNLDINVGDEMIIDITIKTKSKTSHIQFNRTIKDIQQETNERNTTVMGKLVYTDLEYILQ